MENAQNLSFDDDEAAQTAIQEEPKDVSHRTHGFVSDMGWIQTATGSVSGHWFAANQVTKEPS